MKAHEWLEEFAGELESRRKHAEAQEAILPFSMGTSESREYETNLRRIANALRALNVEIELEE